MSPVSACDHAQLSLGQAVIYCCILSVAFVASLYLIVPSRVRILDRSDTLQIKWRTFASAMVCLAALVTYPFLFCNDMKGVRFPTEVLTSISKVGLVLLHVGILYSSSIIVTLLEQSFKVRRRRGTLHPLQYAHAVYNVHVNPIISAIIFPSSDRERWVTLRNLVIAPMTEEIVFRGCMVPVLMATGLRRYQVCFAAPLFFGFAHAHHMIQLLRQGQKTSVAILQTAFQFAYTTLFGTYVSFVYIETGGSLLAVTICHSFCNVMGLPNLSFLGRESALFRQRWWISAAYFCSIACFASTFWLTKA